METEVSRPQWPGIRAAWSEGTRATLHNHPHHLLRPPPPPHRALAHSLPPTTPWGCITTLSSGGRRHGGASWKRRALLPAQSPITHCPDTISHIKLPLPSHGGAPTSSSSSQEPPFPLASLPSVGTKPSVPYLRVLLHQAADALPLHLPLGPLPLLTLQPQPLRAPGVLLLPALKAAHRVHRRRPPATIPTTNPPHAPHRPAWAAHSCRLGARRRRSASTAAPPGLCTARPRLTRPGSAARGAVGGAGTCPVAAGQTRARPRAHRGRGVRARQRPSWAVRVNSS